MLSSTGLTSWFVRLRLLCGLAFLIAPTVYAQQVAGEETTEVCLEFRVSRMRIDTAYASNDVRLRQILTMIRQAQADTTRILRRVTFCGAASPEGNCTINQRLSQGRMEAIARYVRSRIDLPDSIVTYDDAYIPWEWLSAEVRATASTIPCADDVLRIIGDSTLIIPCQGEARPDPRVDELKRLCDGQAWRTIFHRYFRSMRKGCVLIVTAPRPKPLPVPEPMVIEVLPPADTIAVLPPAPEPEPEPAPEPEPDLWTPKLYVKTNLLAYPLLIPNVAVEWDFAPHWSVALPIYYSAFNYFKHTIKFRTFAVQPEVRYWLKAGGGQHGSDGQTGDSGQHASGESHNGDGWFVGLHAGVAWYNLAVNSSTRIQDHKGGNPALGGGLSVGYRLPLGEKHWKLEFSAGAGIYRVHYDKWANEHEGVKTGEVRKTYVGPDQLSVSLIYTFQLKQKQL